MFNALKNSFLLAVSIPAFVFAQGITDRIPEGPLRVGERIESHPQSAAAEKSAGAGIYFANPKSLIKEA